MSPLEPTHRQVENAGRHDALHAMTVSDLPDHDVGAGLGCDLPGVSQGNDVIVATMQENGSDAFGQCVVSRELHPCAGDK